MTRYVARTELHTAAEIVAPPALPNRVERSFDLHPALHVGVFGGFAIYLGMMWAAFGEHALLIPFAIFFVFLAAFFVVPAMWAKVEARTGPFASWADFQREGFTCETGHLTARETIAQVLIMPAMLLFWGVSIALIRALA